ncbi:MAG: hypothetical protein ACXW6K_25620, partial [Candidatus Binatia bacterium]
SCISGTGNADAGSLGLLEVKTVLLQEKVMRACCCLPESCENYFSAPVGSSGACVFGPALASHKTLPEKVAIGDINSVSQQRPKV